MYLTEQLFLLSREIRRVYQFIIIMIKPNDGYVLVPNFDWISNNVMII